MVNMPESGVYHDEHDLSTAAIVYISEGLVQILLPPYYAVCFNIYRIYLSNMQYAEYAVY